ncbi:MAG: adenylate/guanylate cyclase domain-containing protein [Leptolyngbyaceae cyanobacterium CSU_1_3]|nr:adenylate/guanylate cyclase domain-containing protein [Leptolyngbyaceae cyanobacterium CSU_1_3]
MVAEKIRRSWRLTPTTIAPLLVCTWAICSAVATALNLESVRVLELQTQSLFFHLRGPVRQPDNIVILAIDDASIDNDDDASSDKSLSKDFSKTKELAAIESWPWRRTAYAQAIERVMAAGARAVAVDIVLDVPSLFPEDDRQLQATLNRHAGRVTLAASHAPSSSTGGGLEQLIYPDSMFQTAPKSIGFINYQSEADGSLRRFTDSYLNSRIDPDLRDSQEGIIAFSQASLQSASLPFSPGGNRYIFFYGEEKTFPTISFWEVLHSENWEVLRQQRVFKNKLVLIGPTATLLHDKHLTPVGVMSGVEIHANAIATMLEGRAISEAVPNSPWRGVLILLGVGGVNLVLGKLFKRSTSVFLAALAVGGGWVGVSYFCFVYGGLILPVTAPAIAICLSGLSYLSTGALSDQFEKRRLRRTLERYVASPIVKEILSQPEDFQALLQGRKLKAAVLFCDVRGFTSLSYQLSAEQLVAQLNAYLNAMVEAIVSARGTIDKFIGDSVMAEFGSPVSQGEKNDAMNSIRAALAMRKALLQLQLRWRKQGKVLFHHGIGISYGEVIAGNIGSLQRMEYTVIGDAVNVASRVQGLTKEIGTDILITEALRKLVQDKIETVFVGERLLRGREANPVRIYSLIGLKGGDRQLYEQVQAGLPKLEAEKHISEDLDREC